MNFDVVAYRTNISVAVVLKVLSRRSSMLELLHVSHSKAAVIFVDSACSTAPSPLAITSRPSRRFKPQHASDVRRVSFVKRFYKSR